MRKKRVLKVGIIVRVINSKSRTELALSKEVKADGTSDLTLKSQPKVTYVDF